MTKISYLASVFSLDADEYLMQARYEFVEKWIHENQTNHLMYYSPIASGYHYAKKFDLPCEYEYHKTHDRAMVERMDFLTVLMMNGWESSIGVQDEIAYAKLIGKEVVYIEVDDWSKKRARELVLDELSGR